VTWSPHRVRDFSQRSRARNAGVTGRADDRTMTDLLPPHPAAPREGRDLALQSRRVLGLSTLLQRRPELRGVGTWPEEMVQHVLWSA
jgi:hypothetical protein